MFQITNGQPSCSYPPLFLVGRLNSCGFQPPRRLREIKHRRDGPDWACLRSHQWRPTTPPECLFASCPSALRNSWQVWKSARHNSGEVADSTDSLQPCQPSPQSVALTRCGKPFRVVGKGMSSTRAVKSPKMCPRLRDSVSPSRIFRQPVRVKYLQNSQQVYL
jgi:hypothetical protein